MARALVVAGLVAAFAASGERIRADDGPAPSSPLEALAPRSDAGRVEAGTPVEHTYLLRNGGSKILQILAKPSCGCTTTEYDRTIAPGAVGKVTARLDTTSMHGRVEKHIAVMTNDPAQPTITLTLAADIQPALPVEPDDRAR